MEIEKKYLIKHLSMDLKPYQCSKIEQGYVSTDPVIRIRKKDNQYYLTCKSKGLLARQEFEIEIEQDAFQHLLKKIDYCLVSKTRYYIPYMNSTIELDRFEGALEGLVIAEVEFDSIEEANAFSPPSWFDDDITQDVRYQNNQLCQVEQYINNV